MGIENSEDIRVIYQQDCESFRYQDKLFWSRFQTLIVIEGAAIGVILSKTFQNCPAKILAFGMFLLCVLISLLAIKDRNDSKNFINRISEYESNFKVQPIRPKRTPIDSFIFTIAISSLLGLLNIYLIYFTFST